MDALAKVRALPKITLGEIVEHAESEAILILCLVTILPFMQPIPIPGLSSILGLVVLMQGLGLMFWGRPLLTKKMSGVVIAHDKFDIIYRAALRFTGFTARLSAFKHPVTKSRVTEIFCGFAIALSAAFLSLPLPIPFSNFVPALAIFLICVGLIEEDVVLVVMGHGITATVCVMAVFSYQILRERFHGWF
jgi:hypothetical protein